MKVENFLNFLLTNDNAVCIIATVVCADVAHLVERHLAKVVDNKMTKTDLKKATGTSSHTITKLGHDEPVSLDFLVRVCQVFHCDIGDIMEVILDEE